MQDVISIRGARVHNLKSIDVDIPRKRFVVITGPSGSGKSSLALDTIFAEGQKRYIESLSTYARQFLEQMDRPDVDEIRGISPTVAIEQKNRYYTYRSTVGTATEVTDYLRLLFARIGKTICPQCKIEVKKKQKGDVIESIMKLPSGSRLIIAFPPLQGDDNADGLLDRLRAEGFVRLIIKGKTHHIEEVDANEIDQDTLVVADRLTVNKNDIGRLSDSIETAFHHGRGRMAVVPEDGEPIHFASSFICDRCGLKFIEPQPRLFSFNNPFGACPVCRGFGDVITIDMDKVVPDRSKSIRQGAVVPWNTPTHKHILNRVIRLAPRYGIPLDIPFKNLTAKHIDLLKHGDGEFPGIYPFFKWIEKKKYKIGVRVFLSRFRGYNRCPECGGTRLRKEALWVYVANKNIGEISSMTITECHLFFKNLKLTSFEKKICDQIYRELLERLSYLDRIGVGYLTLNRRSATLSGGEAQRINLATALGSTLTSTTYILDEPTIGLHPIDNQRLIQILHRLRDSGNTVIVIEHDKTMMESADQILELGPLSGERGGAMVYQGSFENLLKSESLTGQYLSGKRSIPVPRCRRGGNGKYILIKGAYEHNLKKINVTIPLGCLVAITGVSGSGKSTLIEDVLYPAIKRSKGAWPKKLSRFDSIDGIENIDDAILVDQTPIGKSSRSNPATYIKCFDIIRKCFASTRAARMRGYSSATFSFNSGNGRCEKCGGNGQIVIDMAFLTDVVIPCDVCNGKKYKKSVLEVRYRGKNIDDVLNMTVEEALNFFKTNPSITRKLVMLENVGLGYIRLGQPAPTLSGGEAQRLKLALHMTKKSGNNLLYLFDEPTTGLHFHDISNLIQCFDRLIEDGNSIVVIEHNLDVIKCADWIIDLGPGGGENGGMIVAEGPPERIAMCSHSLTGKFLKNVL